MPRLALLSAVLVLSCHFRPCSLQPTQGDSCSAGSNTDSCVATAAVASRKGDCEVPLDCTTLPEECYAGDTTSAIECFIRHSHPAEQREEERQTSIETSYGEVLDRSQVKLLREGRGLFGLPAVQEDVFFDLGSGSGKLPMISFLMGVGKSHGIELMHPRHITAVSALHFLNDRLPAGSIQNISEDKTELRHGSSTLIVEAGDLLQLPIGEGSIMFAASICFPESVMVALVDKFRREALPGTILWTLKELPWDQRVGLASLGKSYADTTFGRNANVSVYMRVPEIPLPPTCTQCSSACSADIITSAQQLYAEMVASLDATMSAGLLEGDSLSQLAAYLRPALPRAALRVLRAFGASGSRSAEDACGCITPEDPHWSMTGAEVIMMIVHGVLLPGAGGEGGAGCKLYGRPCTVGDCIFDSLYEATSSGTPAPAWAKVLQPLGCVRSRDGRLALQESLFVDDLELTRKMLDQTGRGGLVCTDRQGSGALHLSVQHGRAKTFDWTMEALGELKPVAIKQGDARDRTPLLLAEHTHFTYSLVKAGAEVDAPDNDGATPLQYAMVRGDKSAAKMLLKAGANASHQDLHGFSPLLAAVRHKPPLGPELVQLLVSYHANVAAQHGPTKMTALKAAATRRSEPMINLLLELGANPQDLAGLELLLGNLNIKWPE